MTSAERERLADIERALRTESPDLGRLLGGPWPAPPREHRLLRITAVVAAVAAVALVVAGVVTGEAALVVTAVCPPLTWLVVLAASGFLAARRASA